MYFWKLQRADADGSSLAQTARPIYDNFFFASSFVQFELNRRNAMCPELGIMRVSSLYYEVLSSPSLHSPSHRWRHTHMNYFSKKLRHLWNGEHKLDKVPVYVSRLIDGDTLLCNLLKNLWNAIYKTGNALVSSPSFHSPSHRWRHTPMNFFNTKITPSMNHST